MHQSSHFTAHSTFSHFYPISTLKKFNLIQIYFTPFKKKLKGTCDRSFRRPHCVPEFTMTLLDCDPTLGVFQKNMRQYEQYAPTSDFDLDLDLNLSESLPIIIVST